MAGVAMTTIGKTRTADESQSSVSKNRKHYLVGDLFALLSAMTCRLFTVLLKKFCGEGGEKLDMQKLVGYIGLFTLVALWWLVWPLTAMGIEPKFAFPHSAKTAEIIIAILVSARILGLIYVGDAPTYSWDSYIAYTADWISQKLKR